MGLGLSTFTAECFCNTFFAVGNKFEIVGLEAYINGEWKTLDPKKDYTVKAAGWDWGKRLFLFHVDHPDIPKVEPGQLGQSMPQVDVVFQRLL
jgi:hypothetical protein